MSNVVLAASVVLGAIFALAGLTKLCDLEGSGAAARG